MECPWRRALASVFLLISSHHVRVLSQNVGQTGALPLLNEPIREGACLSPGPAMQKINLLAPNGVLPEFETRSSLIGKFQRIPEYSGPSYSQAINSVPQANIGQLSQSPRLDSPPINCLPNTNIPQQALPLTFLPNHFNPSTFTKITPIQEVTSLSSILPGQVAQSPNFNLPPISQGFEAYLPPVPLVPNLQNQIVPYPQWSLNTPAAGLQNQINVLPTPNLPQIPIQNYVPLSQIPVQTVAYPQSAVPLEYVSNTKSQVYSPNYQVSALPPVFPTNTPPLHDCYVTPIQLAEEEYTPVPINLQINVPSPTIPEPQITIITAYPSAPVAPVPVSTDNVDTSFGMYPPCPLPPIIIESRRSRLRSWLPLFLIALIANDGCCGGCSCCCSCASPEIPIPYPIPIPTNNPIIVGKRNRSSKECSNGKVTINKNSGT